MMDDIKGYWWCPECELEVSPTRVTFQEQCDFCHTDVEWYEIGKGPLWEDDADA